MQRTDSANRLRRLVTSLRDAHARDSLEWNRRMEAPAGPDRGRRS